MIYTDNRYRIILSDNPWYYRDKLNHHGGGAGHHFEEIKVDELVKLPVEELLAHKDSFLFLWCTWPKLRQGLKVMDAWGYKQITCAFVWVKTNQGVEYDDGYVNGTVRMGQGRYTRLETEYCLLGRKRKPGTKTVFGKYWRESDSVRQTIFAPPLRHSAKPPEARDRIVELLGDVPRLELFARDCAEGWDATGYEYDGYDIRNLGKHPTPSESGTSKSKSRRRFKIPRRGA